MLKVGSAAVNAEQGDAENSGADEPGEPSAPSVEGGTAQPDKPARRAGRDLPAAIGVGLALGAAVLAALLTYRQLFLIVIAAAVAIGTIELAGAFRRGADIRIARVPLLLGGQAMVWLTWPFGLRGALVGFVATVLACLLWRMRSGADGYLRDVAASVFAAAYVPLFASFAALLVLPLDGVGRVLTFLIVVVCSDTGGYAAGVLLGRHPMAPSISPKKSWEGFAGSLISGLVAGWLAIWLLLDGQWWQGAILGVAVVCSATLGDLMESLVKRDLGIKDMGTLLPGHGGLMDRLDSLLPSAVLSWMMLGLMLPTVG